MRSTKRLVSGMILTASACKEAGPVTGSCPAPLRAWYEPETGRTIQEIQFNVDLRGETIWWNGEEVEERELTENLRLSRRLLPAPLIMFDPARAESCVYATRIRDIIDREYDCRENKCWQGSRGEFERAPLRKGEVVAPW